MATPGPLAKTAADNLTSSLLVDGNTRSFGSDSGKQPGIQPPGPWQHPVLWRVLRQTVGAFTQQVGARREDGGGGIYKHACEGFHRVLKYVHLQGRVVKRVDKVN